MAISYVGGTSQVGVSGGARTVDLSSYNDGDLCVVCVSGNGATPPSAPAGWTIPTNGTSNAGSGRIVAYRFKQAGDTSFSFTIAGVQSSTLVLEVFRGAAWGQVARNSASGSGTTVTFDALTVSGSSASLLFATYEAGATTESTPSGYSSIRQAGNSPIVSSYYDLSLSSGSLDPDDITLGAARNSRTGFHAEIRDSTVTVAVTAGSATAAAGSVAVNNDCVIAIPASAAVAGPGTVAVVADANASVSISPGTAIAASGGTTIVSVSPVIDTPSGAALATGGQVTPAISLPVATGSATADAGTVNVQYGPVLVVPAATATATGAAAITSESTVPVAAADATAAGGDVAPAVSLPVNWATATAAGGTTAPVVAVSVSAGTATAAGLVGLRIRSATQPAAIGLTVTEPQLSTEVTSALIETGEA